MNNHFNYSISSTIILALFAGSLWAQSPAPAHSNDGSRANESTVALVQPPASPSNNAHSGTFVIGDEDVLAINVWKEPEISRSIPVRSDGKISLPLVGEVQAAGRTPVQLEREITTKLLSYIAEPEVTVMVQQINSEKFNILGQVVKPGSYPLIRGTTVLDAIATASGFRDFAKQKDVYILRQNTGGTESRLVFNYKDVISGKHPEQNIKLEPRDTIIVP
jgi:polysaccharide export outer membrane protein